MLRDFAQAGILECREQPREPISLRATAQWELQSETASVWLLDYSRGGFRLLSQTERKPGERTLLQLERDDGQLVEVSGKTLWQVESQDGFVIGCEFLDHRDFSVLGSFADSEPQDNGKTVVDAGGEQPKRRSLLGHSHREVAVGAAVLLCILIAGYQIRTGLGKQRSETTQIASSTGLSKAAPSLEQLAEMPNNDVGQDPTEETVASATTGAVPSPTILAEPTRQLRPNENVESLDTDLSAHETRLVAGEADEDYANEGHTWSTDSTPVESNAPHISPLVAATLAGEGQSTETTVSVESWEVRILKPEPTVVETPRQVGATVEFGVLNGPPTDGETSAVIDAESSDTDNNTKSLSAATADDTDEIGTPNDNASLSNSASPNEDAEKTEVLPLGYRRWQDITGRYRVVARLVAVQGNIAQLRTKDGRRVSVPMDRLSQDDVRFIGRWLTVSKKPVR